MKQLFFISCLLLLVTGCQKIPPETAVKTIATKITNLKGQELKEAAAGTVLRLSAPEFVDWNKQGLLQKEGLLSFNGQVTKIMDAADDYILTSLPTLNFINPRFLDINLLIGQEIIARLCLECLLYRPTVSGQLFSGFSGGAPDGSFRLPAEMTHDAAGNLYVIDQQPLHDRIMRVSPAGVASLFAGGAGEFGRLVGIAIDESRNRLYVADASAQQLRYLLLGSPGTVNVLAGSGSEGNADGTGSLASFHFGRQAVDDFSSSETGQGLTIDASGNLYAGELYTGSLASQLRRISPEGVVTTVAGSRVIAVMSEDESALPAGITVNAAGELFTVSGSSGFFQGINRFSAGSFMRFAGKESYEGLSDGTGVAAQFSYPKAVQEYAGNLYVADGSNGALRRVDAGGKVITLAGVGHFNTNRFAGTGYLPPVAGSFLMEGRLAAPDPLYYQNAARNIRMDQAGGLTVINGGLIYVSDYGYQCIWKIEIR